MAWVASALLPMRGGDHGNEIVSLNEVVLELGEAARHMLIPPRR